MGKFRSIPSGTSAQQGLLQVGHGLRSPSAGLVNQVVSSGQLWVDFTGSDGTGDGSQGNPYATLAATFAFIIANPLVTGYEVRLPSGDWQETVGIPPTGTTIVGGGIRNTLLSNGVGGNLTWTQVLTPIALEFRNLTIKVDLSGVDLGDLRALFTSCAIVGTFTLVGESGYIGCTGLPTFVNCQTVTILSPQETVSNLSFSYDPLTATNGSSTPGLLIQGGQWGIIAYTATDPSAPLKIVGAEVGTLDVGGLAIARCRATRVLTTLNAIAATSAIEYDLPVSVGSPIFAGFGTFKLVEFLLSKLMAPGSGEVDVLLPIPRQPTAGPIRNVYAQSDLPSTFITYVSNTDTLLTVHVKPLPGNPAYTFTLLCKP